MAKTASNEPAGEAPPAAKPEGTLVTWRPGSGEPAEMTWQRRKWQANVGVRITDAAVVEAAKHNQFFEVEGFERAFAPQVHRDPRTPEEYRAHANAWINAATSRKEMRQMLKEEAGLREACGCGSDDMDLIKSFYEPKYNSLPPDER